MTCSSRIDILASNCWRADGDHWPVLPDSQFRERPLAGIGGPSVHLPYATGSPRRIIVDPLVPRDRRQRSTMERPGRSGGGMAIPARHERLINTVAPKAHFQAERMAFIFLRFRCSFFYAFKCSVTRQKEPMFSAAKLRSIRNQNHRESACRFH